MRDEKTGRKAISLGIISDTHGLLRPEAMERLQGVDHIIHAGDIGNPDVLKMLRTIAPVTAVRGNMDREGWAGGIRETEVAEIGDRMLYVLHDLQKLDLDPGSAGFAAVIFGHSHRPFEERRGGVLFLNPGSAGPRRFSLPVSMALLEIDHQTLSARFIDLGQGK